MKRIALILLCLSLLLFCGCTEQKEAVKTENSGPIVIMPDSETAETVNGYKTLKEDSKTENTENDSINDGYIANKSSKKFHSSSCVYAKKIKAENIETSKNREDLIKKNYQPCKKCNP